MLRFVRGGSEGEEIKLLNNEVRMRMGVGQIKDITRLMRGVECGSNFRQCRLLYPAASRARRIRKGI